MLRNNYIIMIYRYIDAGITGGNSKVNGDRKL